VWDDPTFDPAQPAFYYVRVLENPVCRYSTHYCQQEFHVNPLEATCTKQLERLPDALRENGPAGAFEQKPTVLNLVLTEAVSHVGQPCTISSIK
jgi:hypothetical protein